MTTEQQIDSYAGLAVRVALNLQPGQRLMIIGPLVNGGVSLEAAPLVRRIAARAYDAGAELVEAMWGDEPLQLERFRHARPDTLNHISHWLPRALEEHAQAGHTVLSIYANDPDLFQHEPSERVGALQQAVSRGVMPFRELVSRNHFNWAAIAWPNAAWARKVFPGASGTEQVARLWDAIGRMCRLDRPDPVEAWRTHVAALAERSGFLNDRRYAALKYSGPGTDLTLGLPEGHVWVSGASTSRAGIRFVPNLPTEEVFTIADRSRVDGTVRSTKPLSYGGSLIEDFTLRFEAGRVAHFGAARGEHVLRQMLETDETAGRLGEVALVPASSPVAASEVLFYNTLFDENAASHLALGTAYKFTLRGGEAMSDEEFQRAGGNTSAIHVDFMIGSSQLDVDGVLGDGRKEPLMRDGEWVDQNLRI